jgi:glyoxylase-like metal-dependent hydrolase (beta-lactamase superfamily II)
LVRSRWKTATACTSGWKISSCQSKKLLLHNKKEWSSYGSKQLKDMAELDASIQERDVDTQLKSTYKAVEVATPCAYRKPEDVSRRLHRAEMQYESQIETQRRYIPMKSINKAVKISAQTMRTGLKRNSVRFAAALLMALASLVAGPNAALAAAAQHHDQAPGFYRLKVGDLEVTALYDGTRQFDPHWLNGTKATMDGVTEILHEDPHMLDVVDSGFVVNTGQQLILVDAGAGAWWGGGALGRLVGSLRSAGYTPEEVDIVLLTHLHSDHVGGLTTQDGKRVFPNADVYVAKAESDFWLSPEIAAKAPKDAQPFFQSAQAITAPYIKAGKWHTFSGSEPIVDGMQTVPLPGHTPGHTGYEFSSKGQQILFCGDIVHAQRVQLQHPEVTAIFDIDQTAAAVTRHQLLSKVVREGTLIATPHSSLFPPLGRLREEGSGHSWVPVVFTDQWDER